VSSRLLGREQALAAVRSALADARAGRGRLLLIAGDAGIGKTAVAAELLGSTSGALVTWASCQPGPGAPAYWPWVQTLRGLGRPMPVETDRFRFFDAIASQLVLVSRTQPLVVVLDDLHWSDDPSLLALAFVAQQVRTARIVLLGTYREAEAGSLLLDLSRGAEVVQLGGLFASDVARLMTSVAGVEPPADLAADVWRRTGGNPFFVRELTRLLYPDGVLRGRTGDEVPDGVRDVLRQRLAALPAECRSALDLVAVLGGQCNVDLLAELRSAPAEDTIAVLEQAVRARVLVRPPAPPRHFRFTHDLFRATVYEGLSPAERAERHRAAGDLLRRHGVSAAELAAQYTRAGAGAAAEAADWSRQAGAEAVARLAYEDACGHFERALVAVPGDLATLLDLGAAQHRSGRRDAARATFLAAAGGARTAGDAEPLARAALGVQRLGVRAGMADPEAVALLAEAVDGPPTPQLPLLLAEQARILHHSSYAEARPVAERAVALARAQGDPGVLAACLLALHDAQWRPGSARERRPTIVAMATAARDAGDRERVAQARLLEAGALIELGDPDGVVALADYCRMADDLRHPTAQWQALTRRTTLALITGPIDEVAGRIQAAVELGQRIGEPDAAGLAGAQAWLLTLFYEFEKPPFELPVPDTVYGRSQDPMFVAFAHMLNRDRDAAARVMSGYRMSNAPQWHDPEPLVIAAHLLSEFGPDEARQEAYDMLLPLAGQHSVVGGCASYQGAIDHHLGRLAAALGRPDRAAEHFAAALAMYEKLGAPAWAALVRAAGEFVFRRDGAQWIVRYDGVEATVPDSKGMRDLATLIAAPGRDVHVRELLGVDRPLTGSDEVLDARARAAYKARLVALDDEIDEASANNDLERATRARAERDFLIAELSAATGLGGRSRRLDDESEKARKTVTARIKYTLNRLSSVHPALAEHLVATVHTGVYCRYSPR
jgi:tetratricopeptide (TPR) repeat protein